MHADRVWRLARAALLPCCSLLVQALAVAGSAVAQERPAGTQAQSAQLRVVATPNPAVFALLLALERDPGLAVRLLPAADGQGMLAALDAGEADAMVAMLATEARLLVGHPLPGAQISDVWLWRGFSVASTRDSGIASVDGLRGKGLLVAGPLSGGRDGGPDLMLQAGLRHQGVEMTEIRTCYMPVRDAVDWYTRQKNLGDHANCEPDKDLPPSALLLTEPATTALAMMGSLPGRAATGARLPLETMFPTYGSWARDELPLGGMAVLGRAGDPQRAGRLAQLRLGVEHAIQEISVAKGDLIASMQVARAIAKQFDQVFGPMKLEMPTLALAKALYQGGLVYRSDRSIGLMQDDLGRWLADVLGVEAAKTNALLLSPGPAAAKPADEGRQQRK